MNCDHLEPLIEGFADGSARPEGEDRAHLDSCARCQARLALAHELERFLMAREAPAPPAAFTAGVMRLVSHARMQTERVVDLGFNLAMAAGVLVILSGIGGLAWSLGFLTVTIDAGALLAMAQSELSGPLLSQVQTVAMGAVVLTITLALWWWAEADPSL